MSKNTDSDISYVLKASSDFLGRIDHEPLEIFLDELFRWNPQLGLVSKQKPAIVAAGLIRHSVRLWDFAVEATGGPSGDRSWRVVDIGTGGGFPGLVWKLLVPDLKMTLIERKVRKAAFLERTAARLGLNSVEIIGRDAREVVRMDGVPGKFDLCSTVAVAPPAELAREIERLLRLGGHFATLRPAGETGAQIPSEIGRHMRRHQIASHPDATYVLFQRVPSDTTDR
jgi:16S rRNA (guanine(527)-N(7))-methyltransferase RsmG